MPKTTIEIETEDLFELSKICDIVAGYLNKKKMPFKYISYTKCDDGRQFAVIQTGDTNAPK